MTATITTTGTATGAESDTSSPARGSYWITTFGCQMNKADSERMAGILESMGYREAPAELEAERPHRRAVIGMQPPRTQDREHVLGTRA